MSLPSLNQPFVVGSIQSPVGHVPQVSCSLTWVDHWGSFKARLGVGRMHYSIEPGLYALGTPGGKSPVLVTANYKMSFDCLRSALPNLNAWILVLDTKGINVWCAAGKGTFSTDEILSRIQSSRLGEVISHRELILPQLGASGVSAHKVREVSGFKVCYGPIRAIDIPAFIDEGFEATPEMRRKTFQTWERTVLIPVDFVGTLKWAVIICPALFCIAGIISGFKIALNRGAFPVIAFWAAILSGSVLTPMFLPLLPGRAFSCKGLGMGLITAGAIFMLREIHLFSCSNLETLAWVLLILSISSYQGMKFTGSSTYTSLSGVKKEMHYALPFQIGGCLVGLILWIISLFIIRGA